MKYKRNPVTLVIAFSPLLFMLLVLLSLFIAEDTLVINIGIVALRQVRIFVEVICLICFMWMLIVGVAYFKKPKVKEGFNVDGAVRKRIEAALCLFSSFELSHNDNTWFLLNNIREDVKTVLNFYLSLNDLVVDEKYSALYDTDDILEAVLNSMLQHVVQLDRYYHVMYGSDANSFRAECKKCSERTHALRQNAQEFVQAVLKYMNDADVTDDASALAHIQSFKNVILGEVDLADKYL